jgi:hypothetical protein
MMETVNIGRWTLEIDREATELAFSRIPLGSPETCECDYCKNFVAARDHAYPPEAREMFATLGIDYQKEAETWEWYRVESGDHSYGGFFHCVGSITGGTESVQWQDDMGTYHLERIGEYFEYGFRSGGDLVEEPFKGQPLFQLDFTTLVPWVIDAPDPDESFAKRRTLLTKLREWLIKRVR